MAVRTWLRSTETPTVTVVAKEARVTVIRARSRMWLPAADGTVADALGEAAVATTG